MPSALEYEQRILTYDWEQLLTLWEAIESRDTPGWDAGKAFEYLVLRAFQLDQADVVYPYGVRVSGAEIEQIDGIIYVEGLACLVECKDWSDGVSIEPIAKMRNQLMRRHASTIGIVFSHGGFTAPAVILARYVAPQMILLWDGNEVGYALRQRQMCQALRAKYRFCIEQGDPLFDIRPREALELP